MMSLRRIREWLSTDAEQLALEPDEVFHVLGDRRRRQLLTVLDSTSSGEMPLDMLAREVAAREEAVLAGDVPREAYQRVRIALYQSHLVVLDDLDVLEWDEKSGVVAPREPVAALATIVEDVDRRCR